MVETWACGDKAVLYSDDSRVWQAALEAGLKPMAEYRRPDGVLFAKQFVGDGEVVQRVVEKVKEMVK
ncbi:MAG TPA: hypothetical protein GXX25_07060 [Desulfotomaculum sp.]|nr:hypothetical protein [Desulfotomaculum sp.]